LTWDCFYVKGGQEKKRKMKYEGGWVTIAERNSFIGGIQPQMRLKIRIWKKYFSGN